MKRTFGIFIALLLFGGALLAEGATIGFLQKPFPAGTYRVTPPKATTPVKLQGYKSHPYDYVFANKQTPYEVRYVMFSEEGTAPDDQYQVSLWALGMVDEISGDKSAKMSTNAFKKEDVGKEFNADFGITTSFVGDNSDFTADYHYIVVNFFYKKGLGIMCQAILFNDIDFVKTVDFDNNFHSFRFN